MGRTHTLRHGPRLPWISQDGPRQRRLPVEHPRQLARSVCRRLRMDETEITNSKYKQFVLRVRDSIIRERLADPAFGGNEEFKIEEDREGNPVTPHLNWSKPIPGATPTKTSSGPSKASTEPTRSPVHANSTPNSSTTAMRSTTTPKPPAANTVSTPRAANTTPTAPSPQPLLSSRKTLPGSATKARSSVRPSHAD